MDPISSNQSPPVPPRPIEPETVNPAVSKEMPGQDIKQKVDVSEGVDTQTAPPSVTQQPSMSPQPTSQSPAPPPVVTAEPKRGPAKSTIIFAILGVIALIIWGVVVFLYFQNRKIKNQIESEEQTSGEVSVTPTPEFTPDQVKLLNGSVIQELSTGEVEVIVDKEDYDSTGITGFARVVVSPDNQRICFESWPPAPEPALYYSDIDGGNINEVSPNRKNCVWLADSKSLIYINDSMPSASINIYKYNITTGEETNLTGDSVEEGVIRRYEIISLSADGSKIICKFEDLDQETELESNCEIDLNTGEVEIL